MPDGAEAQATMQEPAGSEEDDAGEGAAPPEQHPPLDPMTLANPADLPAPADPSLAVRADLPSTATASSSADVTQTSQPPPEEAATAAGPSQPAVAVDKPEARRTWPVKENLTSPDGPLSHKFMVLQSRLHKASQLIARESDDLQVLPVALDFTPVIQASFTVLSNNQFLTKHKN